MEVADGLAGQEREQRAFVLGSELLHFGGHARQRYLKSPPYTPRVRRAQASRKSKGLSRAQGSLSRGSSRPNTGSWRSVWEFPSTGQEIPRHFIKIWLS